MNESVPALTVPAGQLLSTDKGASTVAAHKTTGRYRLSNTLDHEDVFAGKYAWLIKKETQNFDYYT
jgi:hypothetical protein